MIFLPLTFCFDWETSSAFLNLCFKSPKSLWGWRVRRQRKMDSLCFHFCLSTWISVAGDGEILIWSLLNFHMCKASSVIDQLLQLRPPICFAAWEDILLYVFTCFCWFWIISILNIFAGLNISWWVFPLYCVAAFPEQIISPQTEIIVDCQYLAIIDRFWICFCSFVLYCIIIELEISIMGIK